MSALIEFLESQAWSASEQPRIVAVGACAWTNIVRVEAWPRGSAKILPTQAIQLGDGMSASAACAVVTVGGRATWWGRVGDDSNGRSAIESLREAGLDCSQIQWVEGVRGSFCTVLVDAKGERLVVPFHDPALPPSASFLPLEDLKNYAVLLTEVRWFEGALLAMKEARQRGLPTVLDAEASQPGELAKLVPHATHALFSETGLAHLLGLDAKHFAVKSEKKRQELVLAALLAVQAKGKHQVAGVTLGEHGFYWLEGKNKTLHQALAPVVEVEDTLAAGDVFHGVYAWALANGANSQVCAQVAVLAASIKCMTFGGRLGAPNRTQLLNAAKHLA